MPRIARWERVRRTAAALFARNGFAAASVSQLARQARLSKPGIYYHVRDKEELLLRICQSTMTALLESARTAAAGAGPEPAEQLRCVIRAHAAHYWRHSADLVILFGQMRYLSPARQRPVVALERAYLDLVRSILRAGQRRGHFRRVDATVAAFSLFATLNTLDGWYDPRGRLGREALVAEVERLYLEGLGGPTRARRGRRAPAGQST
jgi:AcrR family transcriptional regulator